jgi:protein-S-isoprenylcysteine O-methyltransferase Ste14
MPRPEQAWALVKTALFAATFVAYFVVYLPWSWAIRGREVSYAGPDAWHLLGVVPLAAGLCIILSCFYAFSWTGLGTPAPFDPPRTLVVSGFYRYVRNPMYTGAVLIIIGETTLFGSIRTGLEYAAIFWGCATLFVLIYEEPVLRAKFGASYEEYCRNVPRIIPRRTPWKGTSASAPDKN